MSAAEPMQGTVFQCDGLEFSEDRLCNLVMFGLALGRADDEGTGDGESYKR